jgi:hypothetical protein
MTLQFTNTTVAPNSSNRSKLWALGIATTLAVSVFSSSGGVASAAKKTTTKKKVPQSGAPTTQPAATTVPKGPRVTPAALRKMASELPPVAPVGPRALKLMPLGDDLTGVPESYRGHMDAAFRGMGLNVDFVGSLVTAPLSGGDPDHEGHGAYTIGPDDSVFCDDKTGAEVCSEQPFNLSAGLNSWLDAAEPDIVLVQVGLYDLFEGTYKPGSPGIKKTFNPDGGPAKIAALVAQITEGAPERIVVLATLQQPSWKTAGWAPFTTYNTAVLNLAAKSATDKVVSVDLSTVVIKPAEYLDGFHVKDAVAKRMADRWMTLVGPIVTKLASQSGPPEVRGVT